MRCTGFLGKLLLSGRREQTGPMFECSMFQDGVLSNVREDCFLLGQKKHLAALLVYFCHVENGSYKDEHNSINNTVTAKELRSLVNDLLSSTLLY